MTNPKTSVLDCREPVETAFDDRLLRTDKDVYERLVAGLSRSSMSTLVGQTLRRKLCLVIEDLCRRRDDPNVDAERRYFVDVIDDLQGLGPIEPLLRDPAVSDIVIYGPKAVYIERRGRLEQTAVAFHDERHLLQILQRVSDRMGIRRDEPNEIVDAGPQESDRAHAVVRPLATGGSAGLRPGLVSRPLIAGDLLFRNSATIEMIEFLAACVRGRLNVLVAGGPGSGKSTLLKLLAAYIPDNERIASIEIPTESCPRQSRAADREARFPNFGGVATVSVREMIRNALDRRPDRILIDECRGNEVYDMLQATAVRRVTSLSALRAEDTRAAIARLETLMSVAGCDLHQSLNRRQIASTVDIVVLCSRLAGGDRVIARISETRGVENDMIVMRDIFAWEPDDACENSIAQRRFRATGVVPQCQARLSALGITMPLSDFEARPLKQVGRALWVLRNA